MLAPYGARLFLGHLAEVVGVVLVGTDAIRREVDGAIHQIHEKKPLDESLIRIEEDRAEFDRWRKTYQMAGLWAEVGAADWSPALVAAGADEAARILWNDYPTDPEDEHLAVASVMCEMDALLSANMNMVEDEHWLKFTEALGLPSPPMLCRRERAIDWMLQEEGAANNMNRLLRIVVGAMYPAKNLKSPLVKWARSLEGFFPDMSKAMVNHLEVVTEDRLQDVFRQEFEQPRHASTRRYIAEGRPSLGN